MRRPRRPLKRQNLRKKNGGCNYRNHYRQKTGDTEETDELYNIVRRHRKFAGFVKYETTLTLPEAGVYTLDLGQVGEACWVFADGRPIGDAIVPPYRFTVAGAGEVRLTVVTVSHLGYAMQDHFSAFLTFEPVGLLGPVKIRKNG